MPLIVNVKLVGIQSAYSRGKSATTGPDEGVCLGKLVKHMITIYKGDFK